MLICTHTIIITLILIPFTHVPIHFFIHQFIHSFVHSGLVFAYLYIHDIMIPSVKFTYISPVSKNYINE